MKRLPDAASAHPTNVNLITVQLVSLLSHTPPHFPPGHCVFTRTRIPLLLSSTGTPLFSAFDHFTGSLRI